jgi:Flp pilus assembly protein TadG
MRVCVKQPQKNIRERGAAMVEAALTLSLFLVLTLSLFDFGFSLFLHQTFVQQARAGARYGAICLSDPATCTTNDIRNMVVYNSTTGSGNGMMGLSPSSVRVDRKGARGGPDDRVVVTISGYSFFTLTPGWAGSHAGKPIVVTMPVEPGNPPSGS